MIKCAAVNPAWLKILRDNIRARIPDLMHGGLTFKKAKKEKTEELDVAKR